MESVQRVLKVIVEVLFTNLAVLLLGLYMGGLGIATLYWTCAGVMLGFGGGFIFRSVRDAHVRKELEDSAKRILRNLRRYYLSYAQEYFRTVHTVRPVKRCEVCIEKNAWHLRLYDDEFATEVVINDYDTLHHACKEAEQRWNSQALATSKLEEL